MNKLLWVLAAFMVVYFAIAGLSGLYTDYLWFDFHDGNNLFWTLLLTKFNVHVAFSILFTLLFFLNFLLIRILGGKGRIFTGKILNRLNIPVLGTPARALFLILAVGVIFLGYLFGAAASAYWQEYLMFTNSVPFAGFDPDPIFGLDIGFYVFSLPFYKFLYAWILSSLIIITAFSVFFHFLNGGVFIGENKIEFSLFSRAHISILLGLIILVFALGYRISAYELLFSQIGKFYGAGYTAVNGKLLAYNVSMVLSFIAAVLMFANLAIRSFKLPAIILLALIPANFIIGTVLPSFQQKLIVDPNELNREREYIAYNIDYTRKGYNIHNTVMIPFDNTTNLSYADITRNSDIVENIRLWDWRPLRQSYRQLQELRPYYMFHNINVDRYIIDGKKTAVNIAARELYTDGLTRDSRTWQNEHLIYTHGYGIVMNRVDTATSEGQPEFLMSDMPVKKEIDIELNRPEIYYGEHNNDYIITNTSIQPGEFNYPAGDDRSYTTYEGSGGITIGGFFRKLILSAAFQEKNILISENISSESRIHFHRNISEMAEKFAPFLKIDRDPYVIVADGKIYWMIDAYTISDRFPYSTPVMFEGSRANYIRNSVKIVIDAYNGTMNFYIADENDPVIKVYSKIFPGVFKNIDEMPEYLRPHVRYPETLFTMQTRIFLRYHMTDPTVFYHNEDRWSIPAQIYRGRQEPVQSYYLVTRLPDEDRKEFILLRPFTPYERNNMIGFLTAKCDFPDYGELKLYTLSKERLTYGPLQIEARINQDPYISQQLSLWTQKDSEVLRGNMLVIPIEDSLLYVEPLYLQARTSEMPEMARVIVAFGDSIIMERDLQTALHRLFYQDAFKEQAPGLPDPDLDVTFEERLRDLASQANRHLNSANDRLKQGDWGGYGEEIENLKDVLERMGRVQ